MNPDDHNTLMSQHCDTLEALKMATLALIQNARRHLWLSSPDLMADLLDDEQLTLALSVFARSSPQAKVQLLITSDPMVWDTTHQWVRLLRRLDRIQIRQVLPEYYSDVRMFSIDNEHTLRLQQEGPAWSGWLRFNDSAYARQHAERCQSQWMTASEIPDYRQFLL